MPRTVVGLDVGSTAVRGVEARVKGKTLTVHKQGAVPLPPGAVEGGLIAQPDVVAKALTQLWEEAKFSTRNVRLGVGSASVLVRYLELDWMPEPDLRKSLRYQVADLLPVPVDDANLDHIYLGEREVPATGGEAARRVVRILLVATARDAVDNLVRCAQSAKLMPTSADLGALALIRAAAQTGPVAEADTSEAVLDIGVDKVTVAVHAGGVPHFIRVIPNIGGGLLTRSIIEQTDADWADAEALKCTQLSLPAPGEAPSSPEQAAVFAAARRLIGEVRTTLEFHTSSDPGTRLTRIQVAGATGGMPGLLALLQASLGLPVQRLDNAALTPPLAASGPGERASDLALAAGLCMEVTP